MQNTLREAELNLQEVKNDHDALKQDLSIVESDYFLEKEARNKLGLVRENEVVLVLPDEEILRNLSPRKETGENYQLPDPNWKKWLKLFI